MGKKQTRELFAFYTAENQFVRLHPFESSAFLPPAHPYVLNPAGLTELGQQRYWVVRDYSCQSLKHLVSEFGKTTARMTKHYLRQLVNAVLHLHRNGLTHNRLNMDTVLQDGEGRALLSWCKAGQGPLTEQ